MVEMTVSAALGWKRSPFVSVAGEVCRRTNDCQGGRQLILMIWPVLVFHVKSVLVAVYIVVTIFCFVSGLIIFTC